MHTVAWRRMFARSPRILLRVALLAMCVLALGAALAACGYTTAAVNPGGPIIGPGGSTSSGPGRGTTVRPCVGPYADVGVEGQPDLVLTDATADHTGTVAVGGLVQVQLQSTWRWGLGKTSSNLAVTQYNGAFDQARNLCFWNFRTQSTGTATIDISGTALCEPNQQCPMIARAETFTVQVS